MKDFNHISNTYHSNGIYLIDHDISLLFAYLFISSLLRYHRIWAWGFTILFWEVCIYGCVIHCVPNSVFRGVIDELSYTTIPSSAFLSGFDKNLSHLNLPAAPLLFSPIFECLFPDDNNRPILHNLAADHWTSICRLRGWAFWMTIGKWKTSLANFLVLSGLCF